VTTTFTKIRKSERISIALQEQEQLEDGTLSVRINSTSHAQTGDLKSIRIEAHASLMLRGDLGLSEAFMLANRRLNEIFFQLIPEAAARFGTKA
jgi:hypothetical protein